MTFDDLGLLCYIWINSRTREKFPGNTLNFRDLTEKTEWGSVRKTVFIFYKCVLVICPMEQFGGSVDCKMFRSRTTTKTVKTLDKKATKGPFYLSRMLFIVLPFEDLIPDFITFSSTKLRPCLTEMLDNMGVCLSNSAVWCPPFSIRMSPHNISWKSSSLNSF